MLKTLRLLDFVSQNGKKYRIGPQCLALGRLYKFDADLQSKAIPLMHDLVEETNEVVQLGVIHESQVLYLERVEPQHSVTLVVSPPGSMLPAYCTALGKASLAFGSQETREHYLRIVELSHSHRPSPTIRSLEAFLVELEATRDREYAIDDGEYDEEIGCVAAPSSTARGTLWRC